MEPLVHLREIWDVFHRRYRKEVGVVEDSDGTVVEIVDSCNTHNLPLTRRPTRYGAKHDWEQALFVMLEPVRDYVGTPPRTFPRTFTLREERVPVYYILQGMQILAITAEQSSADVIALRRG